MITLTMDNIKRHSLYMISFDYSKILKFEKSFFQCWVQKGLEPLLYMILNITRIWVVTLKCSYSFVYDSL